MKRELSNAEGSLFSSKSKEKFVKSVIKSVISRERWKIYLLFAISRVIIDSEL